MTVAALPLLITTAGLARFTAAQVEDDIDLTIATIGLTATPFVAAPTLTALPGEFRRLDTLSGVDAGQGIVHLTVTDAMTVAYQMTGFGLFLADGTLFAVYGQGTSIVEKSAESTLLFSLDMAFPTSNLTGITFGNTNFINPQATTERLGVVELATRDDVSANDATRAVTPALMLQLFDENREPIAGYNQRGVVSLATQDEIIEGNVAKVVTAAGLKQQLGLYVTDERFTAMSADFAASHEYEAAHGIFHKLGLQLGPFSAGVVEVEFASPFANAVRSIMVTPVRYTAGGPVSIVRRLQDSDGFSVEIVAAEGVTIDGFDWLAIGF